MATLKNSIINDTGYFTLPAGTGGLNPGVNGTDGSTSAQTNVAGGAAGINTGSGGGGGHGLISGLGGSGGSGIVIIRYAVA